MVTRSQEKAIAVWLLICCFAIFCMVMLGGVTRLTGSGLSMVKWEPITGVLPPLNQTEWQQVFELYQESPEFKLKNFHMDVEAFKSIFWFEYTHRVLGRLIGMIFLFPMLFFFFKGWVGRALRLKLITMFILGGLQGLLGWYMVKSGLVNVPQVSQYRLTAHFGLAVVIYGYILWTAFDLLYPTGAGSNHLSHKLKRGGQFISGFIFFTMLSGGFVAGLKAGYAYSTFPLMNGKLIPDGLFYMEPVWRNFFDNVTTVQFDHRVLAMLLLVMISLYWWVGFRAMLPTRLKLGFHCLLLVLGLQVTLGITTLLNHVPVTFASAHQGGALLLFTASLFVTHQLVKSRSLKA